METVQLTQQEIFIYNILKSIEGEAMAKHIVDYSPRKISIAIAYHTLENLVKKGVVIKTIRESKVEDIVIKPAFFSINPNITVTI